MCRLLVLTPQGLGFGRERSVRTVIWGGKFLASALPLNSFKPCLIFWQCWMKWNMLFVLSAWSSQETDCEVFYSIIIELLLKMLTSLSRGIEVTCSGHRYMVPSLHPLAPPVWGEPQEPSWDFGSNLINANIFICYQCVNLLQWLFCKILLWI